MGIKIYEEIEFFLLSGGGLSVLAAPATQATIYIGLESR